MVDTGRILRIEKLSSFDGQGLRTVVFLKGCPLSCRWCSTPESQRPGTDFGVARGKCTGCFACAETCPEGVLQWDLQRERFITDLSRCTDCRQCVTACPTGARQAWGYTATVDEIFREVEKDSLFYFHSGGGVTVSGGEPLAQPGFVAALLERCLEHGINTAVETSGQAPWANLEQVLPFTDTLFFDLKHLDDRAHREITGVSNTRILDNLKRLDQSTSRFSLVIRTPVIPGLNDSGENIRALGEACRNLSHLAGIQLLPYHRLGIETYERMGLEYGLAGTRTPDDDLMETHLNVLRDMGLPLVEAN